MGGQTCSFFSRRRRPESTPAIPKPASAVRRWRVFRLRVAMWSGRCSTVRISAAIVARVVFALVAVVVGTLAVRVAAAHAATIVVSTTVDELNDDGDCSLREAVRAANLDVAADACRAGGG